MGLKLDKVYVITLDHSQENYDSIVGRINRIGLPSGTPYQIIQAINGRQVLTDYEDRIRLGVSFYESWNIGQGSDWWSRPVTVGEAGLTLSKIKIWEEAYQHGYENVMILEDDFDPREGLDWTIFDELENYDWDLIYLGRILQTVFEQVKDHRVGLQNFVKPGFSYQTHAYILSKEGIKKLVETNVATLRRNLIPADEFLPATYAWHPRQDLRMMFNQNMQALALNTNKIGQLRNETSGESLTAPIDGVDL